jgi:hypothetical protein
MHTEPLTVHQIFILVLAPSGVSVLLWLFYDLHLRSKRAKERRKHIQ